MKNPQRDRLPKAPSGLSLEARELWQKTVKVWRIDDPTLLLCLKNACKCLDRLRLAERIILRDGCTITDRWGQIKQHPGMLVVRDEGKALRENLKMLNLDLDQLSLLKED